MSNVTIYDVAKASGVSLATVSRVLNNPEKVKDVTKKRVLLVIKELGYRPNMIARGLASHKTTTVGVVISDITRASISEMLGGISDIAKKYNYTIKLFTVTESDSLMDSLDEIVSEKIDGAIYLNDELDDEALSKIKETFDDNQIPLVFANVATKLDNVPTVSIDYLKASYEITNFLINDNRKNIYMLSTTRRYNINDLKEQGYTKAILENNLEPKIFRTSGDTNINTQHFKAFFEDKLIDAAIAVRDSIAVSFINVARLAHSKIPDDIAVSGFQNTKYALLSRPTLTCIDIPVYDIGAVAMRLLTKYMTGEKVEENNIILQHQIIRRNSTR
ncbi:MAG: LacI family DNA-binding transcriptional regulator [Acholeplasmatales bacterium]|jgi:LacI family transcriptional regulator|nr:LacI family DNA-binding transcriptional regulator [Acholeplasmatales bacterium]